MFALLLKKALPFTLTFILGAVLGGLGGPFPSGGKGAGAASGRHGRGHGYRGHGRRSCDMRTYRLVAESKPLDIRYQPDAVLPRGLSGWRENYGSARLLVTFGSDGKVQAVEPLDERAVAAYSGRGALWRALEGAAQQIRFEPETINGMPVSVSKEVGIRFFTY